MSLSLTICSIILYTIRKAHGIPPAPCFAPFRSDDCGKPPTPVMYYWKPGSRCEVGIWRGCLPNTNMFPDEYECVATCIFSARAAPEDYHAFNEIEALADVDSDEEEVKPLDGNATTDSNSTDAVNTTESIDAEGNETTTGGEDDSETTTAAEGEVTGDETPEGDEETTADAAGEDETEAPAEE